MPNSMWRKTEPSPAPSGHPLPEGEGSNPVAPSATFHPWHVTQGSYPHPSATRSACGRLCRRERGAIRTSPLSGRGVHHIAASFGTHRAAYHAERPSGQEQGLPNGRTSVRPCVYGGDAGSVVVGCAARSPQACGTHHVPAAPVGSGYGPPSVRVWRTVSALHIGGGRYPPCTSVGSGHGPPIEPGVADGVHPTHR